MLFLRLLTTEFFHFSLKIIVSFFELMKIRIYPFSIFIATLVTWMGSLYLERILRVDSYYPSIVIIWTLSIGQVPWTSSLDRLLGQFPWFDSLERVFKVISSRWVIYLATHTPLKIVKKTLYFKAKKFQNCFEIRVGILRNFEIPPSLINLNVYNNI